MYRQFTIFSMLIGLSGIGTGCCVIDTVGSGVGYLGTSSDRVFDGGCSDCGGTGCDSCTEMAADDCADCGGHGGYGGPLGLGIVPLIRDTLTCGRGCGEVYWNEWINDPPAEGICHPLAWLAEGWRCLWGYRFEGCGSCDGDGCSDCGDCAGGGGCSDCGGGGGGCSSCGGGEISGEMPYYDGQIIEEGTTRTVPNSAKSRVATKTRHSRARTRTMR